jgi:hypothetical protein
MTLVRLDAAAGRPPVLFHIRIDWLAQTILYGEMVTVELHDPAISFPRTLRKFKTVLEAIDFSRAWFSGRGFTYTCDVEKHKSQGHCHIDLIAKPRITWTGQPMAPNAVGLITRTSPHPQGKK